MMNEERGDDILNERRIKDLPYQSELRSPYQLSRRVLLELTQVELTWGRPMRNISAMN